MATAMLIRNVFSPQNRCKSYSSGETMHVCSSKCREKKCENNVKFYIVFILVHSDKSLSLIVLAFFQFVTLCLFLNRCLFLSLCPFLSFCLLVSLCLFLSLCPFLSFCLLSVPVSILCLFLSIFEPAIFCSSLFLSLFSPIYLSLSVSDSLVCLIQRVQELAWRWKPWEMSWWLRPPWPAYMGWGGEGGEGGVEGGRGWREIDTRHRALQPNYLTSAVWICGILKWDLMQRDWRISEQLLYNSSFSTITTAIFSNQSVKY